MQQGLKTSKTTSLKRKKKFFKEGKEASMRYVIAANHVFNTIFNDLRKGKCLSKLQAYQKNSPLSQTF
jgi:hypothetical protein